MNIQTVLEALKKNHMEAYYVETKEEVVPLVKELMPEGSTVSVGGSQTVKETGVMDLLKSGYYNFLDRSAEGITPEEIRKVYEQTFAADGFFGSANAITEKGELVNVDGNANRIAALTFGPKSVIVIAGVNKIVPDLEAAIRRIKTIAAPANAQRLSCDTYCRETGHCLGLDGDMTDGCSSPQRICCSYLVQGPQRQAGRIKVILVNETLGY
ncbi:MAG: lactate utilization protein [Clostridia bacterium]|nr:lactate utilization protein [Clostridia bacterium]